jgi:hypothetical protein
LYALQKHCELLPGPLVSRVETEWQRLPDLS